MTSSKPLMRSVPPPQGSVPRSPNAYARFIPREELAEFAAWTPDVFSELMAAGSRLGAQGGTGPQTAAEVAAAVVAAAQAEAQAEAELAPEPTAADWELQVQQARQQGYQDGYRDGLEALDAAKRQFAQQVSAQMAQLVAAFDEQIAGLEAAMAQSLVETSVELARQVVRTELEQRPDCVAQVAREAVGAVMLSARHLRLRLNPQDVELVEQGSGDALRARNVLMQPDSEIARGGCIVESDLGRVDASIASRWAQAAGVFNVPLDWLDQDGEAAAEQDPA